jgi:hypothetical protein
LSENNREALPKKESFVRSTEQKNSKNRPPLFRGWLRVPIAQVLVFALIISSLPARAQVTISCAGLSGNALLNCLTLQQSGSGTNNSGSSSNSGKTVTIISVAAAAVAALLILYIVKKRGQHPKDAILLNSPPVRFNDVVSGRPTKEIVPVTNLMNDPVIVKAIAVDGKSGALAIGDAKQVPFTLAPGEKSEIPVTISANKGGGKARLRLVVATAKTKKDEVRFIDVSYGQQESKLRKLIP